jgi:hypothetical protein
MRVEVQMYREEDIKSGSVIHTKNEEEKMTFNPLFDIDNRKPFIRKMKTVHHNYLVVERVDAKYQLVDIDNNIIGKTSFNSIDELTEFLDDPLDPTHLQIVEVFNDTKMKLRK